MPTTHQRMRESVPDEVPRPDTQKLVLDPDDPLIPVREIAREAMGRFPSPASIWRWCGKGATGIRLPSVMLSGKWMTSRRCWLEWLEARTAVKLERDTVEDASDSELQEFGLA